MTHSGDMSIRRATRQIVAGVSRPVAAYITVAVVAAVVTALGLIVFDRDVGSWPGLVGLILIAVIGERGRITLGWKMTVSISLLPAIFAAVLYGPLAAMLVFGLSILTYPIPM